LVGATIMLRGASGLAELYGIPPLVVGLTVVAFGTSAPELVVNVLGALRGETALAFGNIAGSNMANIGLVLGLAALITPIAIEGQIIRRELPLLLLATAVLFVMALDPVLRDSTAVLDRSDGVVMLLLFAIFIYITASDLLKEAKDPLQKSDPLVSAVDTLRLSPVSSKRFQVILVVVGLFLLAIGGKMTIDHGTVLATLLGVSPVIIGMFVVAIGTSLPELVTSVMAALKGQADLCVGNVVGSNLFNSMFVLPVTAVILPIELPPGGTIDLFASFAIALWLFPIFIFGKTIMNRATGALFLGIYFAYVALRLAQSI
jgi:cation:H+ antiporter